MPRDDYTASAGGALKLKGVSSSSKISKPHKKKRPKPPQPAESSGTVLGTGKQVEKVAGDDLVGEGNLSNADGSEQREKDEVDDGKMTGEEDGGEGVILRAVGKTEAEKRHEERRRKRVSRILLSPLPSPACSSHVVSTPQLSRLSSPSIASCTIPTASTFSSIPTSPPFPLQSPRPHRF